MSCLVKLFKHLPGLSLYTWALIFIQGNEDQYSEYVLTPRMVYSLHYSVNFLTMRPIRVSRALEVVGKVSLPFRDL